MATDLNIAAERLAKNNDFLVVFSSAKTMLAEALLAADPLSLPALQAASLRHEAMSALLDYINELATPADA